MFLIGRGLSYLVKTASLVGAICVVLMMLHVTADVVGRYLFNAPLPGTTVWVANYYMIIIVFLAIGVGAILQVIWELWGMMSRNGRAASALNILTFLVGLVVMYATDLFVAL